MSGVNDTAPQGQRNTRNRVYRVCGVAVVLCLLFAATIGVLFPGPSSNVHVLFWLETAAGIAFGTSWLVRGEWLIKGD